MRAICRLTGGWVELYSRKCTNVTSLGAVPCVGVGLRDLRSSRTRRGD
ncbi:hypothetical protein [Nocardia asiatica]